ncbi:S53 family peptidase [Actinospica sp. MGRD01-02]|uniref:S53 family peptidase n=1 Tax=Actinospica acidithermotolerans TaxID=2828514 RepID=A0A941IJ86_9ACTN|nr:S53 family peptidase [Actinospica acidithermotolerans]MBR7829169.1 S53 family peptidase [Actinospica acidithermotolerans]
MQPTRPTDRRPVRISKPGRATHRQIPFPRRLIATVAALALALLGLGVGLAAPASAQSSAHAQTQPARSSNPAAAASSTTATASTTSADSATGPLPFGCNAATSPGVMHCLGYTAKARGTRHGASSRAGYQTTGTSTSSGYTPAQLRSAYNLTASGSSTETVAIVDAYNDPNAASDLAVYRSAYGLPACTAATGCFKQESETGSTTSLPSTDYGWSEEESLDLDMVSAICPGCHILLVEAASANESDLDTAENTAAATSGVVAISNSWGGSESSSETTDDAAFNHSGIAITASSGDSGYGVIWPAASPYVTAVGGTSLSTASNARGWTESVWSTSSTEGTGSGCSAYETQPSWQKSLNLPAGCSNRIVADVSAVADPATGVAVYDTANSCGTSSWCDLLISLGLVTGADGWVQVGGTSAASPIIASVYALANNTSSITYGSYPYSHTADLNDVTSGSTSTCTPAYLCTAEPGYDGPTGLGTPNGTGGF